jgi:hypothetical protein
VDELRTTARNSMDTPPEILAIALQRANTDIGNSIVNNESVRQRVQLICRNIRNKALSRLILSCCLAKIHKPQMIMQRYSLPQRGILITGWVKVLKSISLRRN